jgi:hypothetical protein
MPTFKISAVDRSGGIIEPETANTATEALDKFRAATERYARAYVHDEDGNDVSEHELERRASFEGGNS